MNITHRHKVITAFAVFFIFGGILCDILLGAGLWIASNQDDNEIPEVTNEYLTSTEIDAKLNLIREALDDKIQALISIPTQLEYEYKTTIVSINVGAGQNIYDTFKSPGPEWRLREWISIEQQQNTVTFGILWEKESVK
jgi:hypothetical protein